MKKPNLNKEKIKKFLNGVKIVLIILMLVLIYLVSPKITSLIKDMAKFIVEIDGVYITRIIELVLSVTSVTSIFIAKKEVK